MQEQTGQAGFSFHTGPDPEDARRVRVLVFKDGQPYTDLHGAQMVKRFAASAGPQRVAQFCERFATDDAFRTQVMLKHAFACC